MKPLEPCRVKLGRAASICLDVTIFLTAVVVFAYLELLCPNVQRGFFCKDPSISLKFTGDTISMGLIVGYGLLPILFIWFTELIFAEESDTEDNTRLNYTIIWRKTRLWFKEYGIGLMVLLVVVNFTKVLIGTPRPHFFDTCMPNPGMNCTKGVYIESWECTNNNNYTNYFLRDSSRSFPSGHSAISSYTSLFMIWYLQCRIPKLQTMFLLALIQLLFLLLTVLCAVTRITDNRHHWWDVLAGLAFGVIFCCYTCKVLCKNFKFHLCIPTSNVNGTTSTNSNHRSVRRLLTTISAKEEFSLNNLE